MLECASVMSDFFNGIPRLFHVNYTTHDGEAVFVWRRDHIARSVHALFLRVLESLNTTSYLRMIIT
jgi:hypothetical protein